MKTSSYTLTDRQSAYITDEAARLGVGKSEVMRYVLNEIIDRKEFGATTDRPVVTSVAPQSAPLLTPQSADQAGSTTTRIWRSTQARLSEISARTGLPNTDVLDRLLNAPNEVLFALLVGNTGGLSTVDLAFEAIPMPVDGNQIDQFLAEHCVSSPGVSCGMDAIYTSYEHFCDEGSAVPRRELWDHLNERGFVVLMATNTLAGIGLRKTAWAVMTGDAQGYEVTQ